MPPVYEGIYRFIYIVPNPMFEPHVQTTSPPIIRQSHIMHCHTFHWNTAQPIAQLATCHYWSDLMPLSWPLWEMIAYSIKPHLCHQLASVTNSQFSSLVAQQDFCFKNICTWSGGGFLQDLRDLHWWISPTLPEEGKDDHKEASDLQTAKSIEPSPFVFVPSPELDLTFVLLSALLLYLAIYFVVL